jgi:hypothetical protein
MVMPRIPSLLTQAHHADFKSLLRLLICHNFPLVKLTKSHFSSVQNAFIRRQDAFAGSEEHYNR